MGIPACERALMRAVLLTLLLFLPWLACAPPADAPPVGAVQPALRGCAGGCGGTPLHQRRRARAVARR